MKKTLSLLLLLPLMAISQTVPSDATALENIQITNNTTSLTATKVNVQDDNGVINTIPKSELINVIEKDNAPELPLIGEAGKIYVVKNINKIYRWNGTFYSELAVTDISGKINISEKGVTVATLEGGKIPNSQIPALAISETFPVSSQAQMLALSQADQGDVAIRSDISKSFILRVSPSSVLANWSELLSPTDAVTSVAGKVGVVTLVKADVGLANVDNTTDLLKPVSTATQTALNLKENTFSKNTAFNKNFGTTAGTVVQGNDSRINNGQTAFSWGNHTGLYPLYNGSGASGTWPISINGTADRAYKLYAFDSSNDLYWGWDGKVTLKINSNSFGREIPMDIAGTAYNSTLWNGVGYLGDVFTTTPTYIMSYDGSKWRPSSQQSVQSFLGLGSNAYTSTVIPTNTNQLTNGSGYITDVSNKVDKVTGKSLIADTEITRLSTVVNQDISNKANKDGTNASGTWGIDISGNAVSASSQPILANSTPLDLNTMALGRASDYAGGNFANGPSDFTFGSVYNLGGTNNSTLSLQLAGSINHNTTNSTRGLYFRMGNNLNFQNDWKKVWHDGNFNPANYLPLSGGTLTGIVTAPTATAGTNTSQIATTAFVLANSRPYKVYTALLNQTGTNAPVATVLENTLGGTVVWSYIGEGRYNGTLTGAFPASKTICLMNPEGTTASFIGGRRFSNDYVKIITRLSNGTPSDLLLDALSIEIRVYN